MTDVAAPQAGDRITLAGSDVAVPPLGVGTWAWGDKGTWGMGGYDSSYSEATIREAWEACIEAGVTLFDTAEVYGGGESERIIGRLLAARPFGAVRGGHRHQVHADAVETGGHVVAGPVGDSLARTTRDRVHRPLPDSRSDLACGPTAPGRCLWPPPTPKD